MTRYFVIEYDSWYDLYEIVEVCFTREKALKVLEEIENRYKGAEVTRFTVRIATYENEE